MKLIKLKVADARKFKKPTKAEADRSYIDGRFKGGWEEWSSEAYDQTLAQFCKEAGCKPSDVLKYKEDQGHGCFATYWLTLYKE